MNVRTRHALWAVALAVLAGVANLLAPVDILFWQLKSRIQHKNPSGDIVFIAVDEQSMNGRTDQQISKLLQVIDKQNPEAVYINIRIPDPLEEGAVSVLKGTVSRFRHPIYSVTMINDSHVTNDALGPDVRVVRNSDRVVGNIPEVYSSRYIRFFGYTQEMEYSYDVGDRHSASFPAHMAHIAHPEGKRFTIDYAFDFDAIPAFEAREVANGNLPSNHIFDGKTIVIGGTTAGTTFSSMPGRVAVPPSYIFIYAAETLKAGVPVEWGWFPLLAGNILVLFAACVLRKQPRRRHAVYVFSTTLTVTGLSAYLLNNVNLSIAPSLALLVAYGLMRLWALKSRFELLKDTDSGLPSFLALKEDFELSGKSAAAIMVIRVGHFSDIVSVLGKDQMHQFKNHVARLVSVASGNAKVYCEGRLFALVLDNVDLQELIQHCDGLRALCDRGWHEEDGSADIVVTFGIDRHRDTEIDLRLTMAIAAAERARENINPVEFSTPLQKAAKSFEISIQSRIDAALRDRDIHVVYQGQLDLRSGRMVGAEALVRWEDPERGAIPPSFFIQQCEENGRLDAVSEYVALEALRTLKELNGAGIDMTMSLNVSAIQLINGRIVDVLRAAIDETGVNPARLVIEITETARISDYMMAEWVLQTIKSMGIRISLDDFGVGMTNMETLLRLPFDELKIDRVFVSRLKNDPKARLIVQALVNLGQQSKLQVVAEGVEDAATLNALSQINCDIAQGYHISHPLSRDDFLEIQHLSARRLKAGSQ